jgi:hypothetical protein
MIFNHHHFMKNAISCFALCLLFVACGDNQDPETTSGEDSKVAEETKSLMDSSKANNEAWINLFDGKTLAGWHSYGTGAAGAAWQADSGVIHLGNGPKNKYQTAGGGDLVTDQEFDNFVFEIEWKVSKGANSGILFYVQEDTIKYKETWHSGFELQVCDNEYNVDAHVYKRDAGDIYDLIPATSKAAKGFGQWNKVVVTCKNGKVEVALNNTQNLSFNLWDDKWKQSIANSKFKKMPGFGSFKSGHIALQDHGAEVWYRNIRIKKSI